MMKRSVVVLSFMGLLALFAPWLAPADPMKTDPLHQYQPPDSAHFLGTDALGRDVLSRALYGGKRTLLVTIAATLITIAGGLSLGLTTGLAGGWPEKMAMTLVDTILAFPSLLLALVILTLLGVGGFPLALATGLAQVGTFARVARSAVIGIRSLPYVEAARALGATQQRILRHHILPNIQPTLIAYATVVFSYNLLNSAALSFLGLGGEPGIPDWGVMLAEGREAFRIAPWIGVVPGMAITVTVIALNQLSTAWLAKHRR
jgi:ABC-type dipeptide/oligopeptide/nickel transport system permease subunit